MKTWLSFSSGKDSAWTAHKLSQDANIDLCGLFSTVNEKQNRVAMHSTRLDILEEQAKQMQLPLHLVNIPEPCSHDIYKERMTNFIKTAKSQQVEAMAFGDLYLEDVREYREKHMKDCGIKPIFPLWQKPTDQLIHDMIDAGLKTVIVCVDTKQLPESFLGRVLDRDVLNDLPEGVDPCGEKGEFQSCVIDGPMFQNPINISHGEIHRSGQFSFMDLKI